MLLDYLLVSFFQIVKLHFFSKLDLEFLIWSSATVEYFNGYHGVPLKDSIFSSQKLMKFCVVETITTKQLQKFGVVIEKILFQNTPYPTN